MLCAPEQAAAVEHLTGLAEWQAPAAGMFLWLRLLGVRDADDILDALRDAGVVIVPGEGSSVLGSCFAMAKRQTTCVCNAAAGLTVHALSPVPPDLPQVGSEWAGPEPPSGRTIVGYLLLSCIFQVFLCLESTQQ